MLLALAAGAAVLVGLIIWVKGIRTIPQAHVGVVTRFGKYTRTLRPGLNVVNPFTNKVLAVIPVQNRTESLQFAAITQDQASVHFTATIIFTVAGDDAETIQLVAFKFINNTAFEQALSSAVEASVREFVAGKKQAEVLGLRQDIVDHAKHTLDDQLASWGYLLVDLTVNDITFDADVMKSMSRVVAAKNAQTAAEYEGQALLIARTKEAEAEGRAQVIAAENGAHAARLRGEGIAAQRAAIADGLTESGLKLAEAGIDVSMLAFSMWTEALRDVAINGEGNVIFLDGSMGSMEDSLRRTNAFLLHTQPTRHSKDLEYEFMDEDSQGNAPGPAPEEGPQTAGPESTSPEKAPSSLSQIVAQASQTLREEGVISERVAGWHQDPLVRGLLRYWDGRNWTDQTRQSK